MSGCFGNSQVDRWMQSQLDAHLSDSEYNECDWCGNVYYYEDGSENITNGDVECPACYPAEFARLEGSEAIACASKDEGIISLEQDGVEILITKKDFETIKTLAKVFEK